MTGNSWPLRGGQIVTTLQMMKLPDNHEVGQAMLAHIDHRVDGQLNRVRAVFGILALLGILQFSVAVCWAIANYPGGYSITDNFLSDLGRRTTLDGKDNSPGSVLFSRSVVALSISLIPFFAVMPTSFESGRFVLRSSALLSAAGLLGIGLTPYDDYYVWHHVALAFWVVPMFLTVITFFLLAHGAGEAPAVLSVGSTMVVLATVGYAFAGSHNGYVIMQKVLAVFSVVWLGSVLLTVSASTVRAVSARSILVDRQARRYMRMMQRDYRRRSGTRFRD